MITIEEHQRRLELWKQGMSDTEIGEACYCSTGAIFYWRKKNGLRPNYPIGAWQKVRRNNNG